MFMEVTKVYAPLERCRARGSMEAFTGPVSRFTAARASFSSSVSRWKTGSSRSMASAAALRAFRASSAEDCMALATFSCVRAASGQPALRMYVFSAARRASSSALAFLRLVRLFSRVASVICLPTFMMGSREDRGSWKTMVRSLPRILLNSFSVYLSRSSPL